MTKLEEGDVILCTVEKVEKTIVFVKIEDDGEGSIVTSEIAPGRIRNLRAYVVPKKKIVCKILKIDSSGNIHLSLRRVTQKERKEVMEQYKKENKLKSILKSVLKDKTEEIINKIKEKDSISEFLEEAKSNTKELEKLVGKENSEKILNITKLEKSKKSILKKEFYMKTTEADGITRIKKILTKIKDAEIKYLSAGKYSLKVEDEDIKKTDNKLKEILKEIEKESKKNKIEFNVKEK